MSIETIRTGTAEESGAVEEESPAPARKIFEISNVDAEEVAAYARTIDDRELFLERKGGRTFLVAD